jgi:hypothetical protein
MRALSTIIKERPGSWHAAGAGRISQLVGDHALLYFGGRLQVI